MNQVTSAPAPSAIPASGAAPAPSEQPSAAPAVEMAAPPSSLSALPATVTPITSAHVSLAETAAANLFRLRRVALSMTNTSDWTDVGGKPHLNSSGALKVAALFGVSLTGMQVTERRETLGSKDVVSYVARVTACYLEREIDMEGVASSDERFFGQKDGRPLPLSEVNLSAVRKKAVTNAQSRAVKAILALGGFTWAELHAAGLNKSTVTTVGYLNRKEKGLLSQAELDSSRRRIRLTNMLKDLAAARFTSAEAQLRKYTEFQNQAGETRWARSVEEMSESWVAKALPPVEAEWLMLSHSRTRPAATRPATSPANGGNGR